MNGRVGFVVFDDDGNDDNDEGDADDGNAKGDCSPFRASIENPNASEPKERGKGKCRVGRGKGRERASHLCTQL